MRKLAAALVLLSACATQKSPPPSVATAPAPPPAEARNYDFIMGAGKAGFETVTTRGYTREAHFEFNDRGRGPKTDSTIVVDEHFIPRLLKTSGNDYYKTPVAETLETTNGKAAWSNGSEKDAADANGFYISMYGAPEEVGLLARALLAAPDHRLHLLPAGEASIRKLGDTTLTEGSNKQHVTCYEIAGLGFTPDSIWLDDANELFASVSSWSSLIREGWTGSTKTLIDTQKTWRDEANRAMAKRLTHEPEGGVLVITNVRIFDPVTMTTSTPNKMVVIRGNRIEGVAPMLPAGARAIDGHFGVLMPGLWDMHQHFSATDGLLDIANGVTDARDMGNDVDFIVDLKKKFESNELVGPRIVMAALIDGSGPFTGPTKLIVDSEDDARKVIDRVAPLGFEQTKIYSSIKPELVPFIAKYSHEHGMRVSGHIPAGMRAEEAVRAGYDEIQHANMLFLNFMPDVKDTRTPARFTTVGERGALLDLNSDEVKNFIALLREHKTVSDPTLNVFENLFVARKGTIDPSYAAIADRLPPQVRRGFLTGGLTIPDGMDQRYRDSFAKMLALVKLMHDSGITIVAGTDSLPGFGLHRELELYVQAGIPAPEVLRIATLGAATVARRDKDLGTIEAGKLADMVLIDGDPAKNISDIRRVVLVVKDGKVFYPSEIDREIGVQ
jgi:cytosine/adenosine deaminase-related metal-dependent hydrolase